MEEKSAKDSERCVKCLRHASRPLTLKELARSLNWPRKEKRDLELILDDLLLAGTIRLTDRKQYALVDEGKLIQGTLMMTRRGTAYLSCSAYEDDLFVPRMKLGPGMHRDLVIARVDHYRGKNEATIVEVVDRGTHSLVGVVHRVGKGYWLEPRDIRLPNRVRIVEGESEHGELVAAQFCTWSRGADDIPTARIVKRIAKEGEAASETEMLIYDLGLPTAFSEPVIQEAEATQINIDGLLSAHHEDLRNVPFFTVDPESARDFDDAVHVEILGKERWRLSVAVADVSLFVRAGTLMDQEAFVRGTSVYLPDRVIPMLPERLSGDLCSLRPDVDRPALVVDVTVDGQGRCTDTLIREAVIRNHCRLSYQEANDYLEDVESPAMPTRIAQQLEALQVVSRRLRERRRSVGYLELELAEPRIVLTEQGEVGSVKAYDRNESHLMIEDAMLAANVAVAEYCISHDLETLFRVHGEPNEDKLDEFVRAAGELGVDDIDTSSVQSLSRSLDLVADPDVKDLLSIQLLRAMMKAEYQTKLHGHFGLGFSAYLHFTSPIRRFPDLAVHRLVRAKLRGEAAKNGRSLPEIAAQSNRRERLALEAERDVAAMYKCLWLKPRIQEIFPGFVTHVSEKGAFIKLGDTHCDGFLPFSVPRVSRYRRRGRWHRNEESGSSARKEQSPLSVGQRLNVRLTDVNVTHRRVELARVEEQMQSL